MKQDFFKHLPSEIITEILSRLPPQTILTCKCVCKPWHDLIKTHQFAKFHLSKSVPGFGFTIDAMDGCIRRTSVLDILPHNLHDLHLNTTTKLSLPDHNPWIQGSADGLLLLRVNKRMNDKCEHELHLCNPITREHINLHSLEPSKKVLNAYGFGASKNTGKYKAVTISQDHKSESECKVYTIGTGSWRIIEPHALVCYHLNYSGAFLNGNLHWSAHDSNDTLCISCFDIETELFTTLSAPPRRVGDKKEDVILVALEGSLCLCDYTSGNNTFIIWMMKKYGVEKSWTKDFKVIVNGPDLPVFAYPIKVCKDGVILIICEADSLFYYSRKNKTTKKILFSEECAYTSSHLHTPSLLSLKCFTMENTMSY